MDTEREEALWAAAEWPDTTGAGNDTDAGHDSDVEILSQQPLAKRLKLSPMAHHPPSAQVEMQHQGPGRDAVSAPL